MLRKMIVASALAALAAGEASAHPVSFKGGFGVMPEYTPDRQDLELNYSFTPTAALGVSAVRIDQGGRDVRFVLPRFNYRLYRGNEMDSQTNLYAYGGAGASEERDRGGAAGLAGFQADHETRRIYTLLAGEEIRGEGGLDVNRVRYRLGVAPYVAGFDGFHTWLIAQAEYAPRMDDDWTVTPLVRFFYGNYLVEVGSSTRGEVFAAGIFHF